MSEGAPQNDKLKAKSFEDFGKLAEEAGVEFKEVPPESVATPEVDIEIEAESTKSPESLSAAANKVEVSEAMAYVDRMDKVVHLVPDGERKEWDEAREGLLDHSRPLTPDALAKLKEYEEELAGGSFGGHDPQAGAESDSEKKEKVTGETKVDAPQSQESVFEEVSSDSGVKNSENKSEKQGSPEQVAEDAPWQEFLVTVKGQEEAVGNVEDFRARLDTAVARMVIEGVGSKEAWQEILKPIKKNVKNFNRELERLVMIPSDNRRADSVEAFRAARMYLRAVNSMNALITSIEVGEFSAKETKAEVSVKESLVQPERKVQEESIRFEIKENPSSDKTEVTDEEVREIFRGEDKTMDDKDKKESSPVNKDEVFAKFESEIKDNIMVLKPEEVTASDWKKVEAKVEGSDNADLKKLFDGDVSVLYKNGKGFKAVAGEINNLLSTAVSLDSKNSRREEAISESLLNWHWNSQIKPVIGELYDLKGKQSEQISKRNAEQDKVGFSEKVKELAQLIHETKVDIEESESRLLEIVKFVVADAILGVSEGRRSKIGDINNKMRDELGPLDGEKQLEVTDRKQIEIITGSEKDSLSKTSNKPLQNRNQQGKQSDGNIGSQSRSKKTTTSKGDRTKTNNLINALRNL